MRCLSFMPGRRQFIAVALFAALGWSSARAAAPLFLVDTPFDAPQNATVYAVDPSSGALTVRGDLGTAYSPVLALAAADATTLYAAGSDNAGTTCTAGSTLTCLLLRITLDPSSTVPATLEIVGPIRQGTDQITGVVGMTFRNDGVLYMTSQDTGGLYILDPATAQATYVGTPHVTLHGGDITFDADDRLSVWTNDATAGPGFYRLDPATAMASLIDLEPGTNCTGLAAVGHSNELYASNVYADRLDRMDPDAGFTGSSAPLTLDGARFDHKRGDLDSPFCTGDDACDDQNPCTTDRCTPGGCRNLSIDPTCDGVDDDCDGFVDEDYVPAATACGVGACATSGATSCVSGTVVDGCAPAPAQTETCNGVDDDCDGGIDNGVAAPGLVATLLLERNPSGDAILSWTSVGTAQSYQVTRGDLGTLAATGGDFAASADGCVADTAGTSATDGAPSGPSDGIWYLVRARNCGGLATYDEPSGTQSGSRDAELAASPVACP